MLSHPLRRLGRASALAAAVSAFAFASPALAADQLAAGGVKIPGSALTVGVSGTSNTAGSVTARFSGVGEPLFWGADTTTMNDQTASMFSLNTPSGLYSPQPYTTDNQPFTQLSAPVLTGTGTAGDPYVVTSQFRATANLDITQTITHVSGTTRFTATWAIHNSGGSTTALQAFQGADMYVNGNDNGTGVGSGAMPNRQIGSVASDGTTGYLVEQPVSPWTHFFTGMNSPFYDSSGDSTYGSLPDTIDPTLQDSGMGVEWDFTLASNATKTVSVQWHFTAPAPPQAPTVTSVPTGTVNTTTAGPHFAPASGDTQVISYECARDGGAWAKCTSPASVTGLGDGPHSFAVRAVNSAGIPGPETTKSWTVDATPPGAPTVTGAPTGRTRSQDATLTLAGEAGATFKCSVDGGSYLPCSSPLVLTGLSDGPHAVAVKQIDAAGNPGSQITPAAWTVDTTVPTAPAGLEQPAASTATTTTLTFTKLAGHTYECSLDNGLWTTCDSPVAFSGLSVGSHTLKVRALNDVGTVGPETATTWTVLAPPVVEPPVGTPTPEPPVATPTPTATAPTTPAKPTFTATVGGKAAEGTSAGAATVQVAQQAVNVGCKMTGVALSSCSVKLYAEAPEGKARATAQVLVGTGFVESKAGTDKLSVRVVLNATGRELLRTSPRGLDVQVAISGKPVNGELINATGAARLVAKRSTVTIGGFATDQSTLTPAAKRALTKLAAKLRGGATVRLIGNTDGSTDDKRYLHRLGLDRATAVKAFLAAHGAKATYTVVSRGASQPRATNATARGRALNRRVVLQIVA